MMRTGRAFSVGLLAALVLTACAGEPASDLRGEAAEADSSAMASASRVDLTGTGATFPYPLYSRWFNEYAERRGVRINYKSLGSAVGIEQLVARTADFGATDVPMTDAELAAAGTPVFHVPTAIGAVAITYNIPGLTRALRLSSDVIADIYLGRITRWDDPRLTALNPTATLPSTPIVVVRRADASGTSYIFSDYLTTVSDSWAQGPGRGREVDWPVGVAGTGNEGVAGSVKETIGAIGYLEVVYARQNRLPVAHIQNREGRFVSPMPFEIASAAAAVLDQAGTGASPSARAADLRISLVNAQGAQSYPIASFTWLLLAPEAIGEAKTAQLVAFLRWALEDADDLTASIGYVPLPSAAAERVMERVELLGRAP